MKTFFKLLGGVIFALLITLFLPKNSYASDCSYIKSSEYWDFSGGGDMLGAQHANFATDFGSLDVSRGIVSFPIPSESSTIAEFYVQDPNTFYLYQTEDLGIYYDGGWRAKYAFYDYTPLTSGNYSIAYTTSGLGGEQAGKTYDLSVQDSNSIETQCTYRNPQQFTTIWSWDGLSECGGGSCSFGADFLSDVGNLDPSKVYQLNLQFDSAYNVMPNFCIIADPDMGFCDDAAKSYYQMMSPISTFRFIPSQSNDHKIVFFYDQGMPLQSATLQVEGNTANTPSGEDVIVSPAEGINITFSEVTTEGNTEVTTSTTEPAPVTGYSVGVDPVYYDITTSATYANGMDICFTYDPSQFANPDLASLLHFENGVWNDVTTSNDTTNHIVCGHTTSLSPFVVATRLYLFGGFNRPVDNLPTINKAKSGQAIPIKWSEQDKDGNYISALSSVISYGYSAPTTCAGYTTDVEEYVDAGSSSLRYDSADNQFVLTSKTDSSWSGSCRMFTLNLSDGSTHQAMFQFTK